MKKYFLLLSLIVLQACGTGALQPQGENKPDPSNGLPDATTAPSQIQTDDLRLKISTDKTQYLPGETVFVSASAENLTGETIFAWGSSTCAPVFELGVDTVINGGQLLNESDAPMACGGAITQPELGAGQFLSRQVNWDLMLAEGIPAPGGSYQISARLLLSDGDYNVVDTIEVATTVEIVSDLRYLSRLDALEAAYASIVLQDWYQANNYEAKCFLDSDLVAFDSQGTATLQATDFEGETSPSIPACRLRLINGPQWRVGFFNKLGLLPASYDFTIDAVTGVIADVLKE